MTDAFEMDIALRTAAAGDVAYVDPDEPVPHGRIAAVRAVRFLPV